MQEKITWGSLETIPSPPLRFHCYSSLPPVTLCLLVVATEAVSSIAAPFPASPATVSPVRSCSDPDIPSASNCRDIVRRFAVPRAVLLQTSFGSVRCHPWNFRLPLGHLSGRHLSCCVRPPRPIRTYGRGAFYSAIKLHVL